MEERVKELLGEIAVDLLGEDRLREIINEEAEDQVRAEITSQLEEYDFGDTIEDAIKKELIESGKLQNWINESITQQADQLKEDIDEEIRELVSDHIKHQVF